PCGILHPGCRLVIGGGVVVDPAALISELDTLGGAGIDLSGRLTLSNRAHLIFPYHRQMEAAAEDARADGKIGTTKKGIGPAYEDKAARDGLRVSDLMDAPRFREKLARVIHEKEAISRAAYQSSIDGNGIAEKYLAFAERLRPFVGDDSATINE